MNWIKQYKFGQYRQFQNSSEKLFLRLDLQKYCFKETVHFSTLNVWLYLHRHVGIKSFEEAWTKPAEGERAEILEFLLLVHYFVDNVRIFHINTITRTQPTQHTPIWSLTFGSGFTWATHLKLLWTASNAWWKNFGHWTGLENISNFKNLWFTEGCTNLLSS